MQDLSGYFAKMGFEGRDRVTGFAGVVESVSFDLYGCVVAVLKPKVGKDGKDVEGRWFDWKRIELTGKKPVMAVPSYAHVGSEIGAAPKPPFPTRPGA